MSFDILRCLPHELSVLVIRKLDGKSILRCRRVSRSWMKIIDSIDKDLKFWTTQCYKEFPHFDESIYNNLTITPENFYRNLCLWPQSTKASITFHDLIEFDKDDCKENITDIYRFQDALTVVQQSFIKQYDLKTGTLINDSPLSGNYSKIRENYYGLFVLVSGVLQFTRNFQIEPGCGTDVGLCRVTDFCVNNNIIFYTNREQNVKRYDVISDVMYADFATMPNLEKILTMECFNGILYLVTKSGILFKFVSNRFIQMDKFNLPMAYHLYGLLSQNIFFCAGFGKLNIYAFGKLAIYDLDISVIKMHANILLLATPELILVFHIKQESDFLKLDLEKPLLRLYPNAEKPIFTNIVIGLDILEHKSGHEIIIATNYKISSIVLHHTWLKQLNSKCLEIETDDESGIPHFNCMNIN